MSVIPVPGPSLETASCQGADSPGMRAGPEGDAHHQVAVSDCEETTRSSKRPKRRTRPPKKRSKPTSQKTDQPSKVKSLPALNTTASCHDSDSSNMRADPEYQVHHQDLVSDCELATTSPQRPKKTSQRPKKGSKPTARKKRPSEVESLQPLKTSAALKDIGTFDMKANTESDAHRQALVSDCEEATTSPQRPKKANQLPKKGSRRTPKKTASPFKAESSPLAKAFAKTTPRSRPLCSMAVEAKSSSPPSSSRAPQKRTSKEPSSCNGPSTSKRGRSNSESSSGKSGDVVTWCKSCRKRLNPPEVVNFSGDPNTAVEEFVALIDPRLTSSLCSQDDLTEQPQFKITRFTVYDEYGHVCPFDSGLIESDVPLYMSGYMKSICAEDPSTKDGVPVTKLGPIVSWWTTGYDGGSNVVLGITTAFAEYILMNPSPQYKVPMKRMQEKIYLVKGILEHLLEAGVDVAYDDVVGRIEQLTTLPQGVGPFSVETVHRHAQFLVDHIQAYDAAGGGSDTPLLGSVFVKDLTRATGAVIRDSGKKNQPFAVGRKKTKKAESKASLQLLMPSVEKTIFELFQDKERVVANQAGARKGRCGFCEACLATDCKHCVFCKNMKKYGGSGTFKQCCVRRRCDNRDVRGNDDHLGVDFMDKTLPSLPKKPFAKRRFPPAAGTVRCNWLSPPLKIKENSVFYSSVQVGESLTVRVGDDVIVISGYPQTPDYVGRVVALLETTDSKSFAHVVWFRRYSETVMGNVFGDPAEVFLTSECDDVPLAAISSICSVDLTGVRLDNHIESEGTKLRCNFFCDVASCVFRALSLEEGVTCGCRILSDMDSDADSEDASYEAGDCVFVKPEAVAMPRVCLNGDGNGALVASDSESDVYSERYRKLLRPPKIEDAALPEPYRICQIVSIKKESGSVIVRAFYRVQEVQQDSTDNYLLLYSVTSFEVSMADIVSKCQVIYRPEGFLASSLDAVKAPFYFRDGYDVATGFFQVSHETMSIGPNAKPDCVTVKELFPSVDVYCGSGGLSLGLCDAGLTSPVFAVSDIPAHRDTFKNNFPDAAVPSSDPKTVLKELSTFGVANFLGSTLREDIFLLCGSPSFESLKHFRPLLGVDSEAFRESQVSTFLSYCEFFEPEFVVLAAERGMIRYHNGAVLVFVLQSFLNLGYQVSCSVLQDGCYGPPQRNRRLIILAAKKGQILPSFPQATHTFEVTENELSFVVNGRVYSSPLVSTPAAPFRRMTLRDAIGDLQEGSTSFNSSYLQSYPQRGNLGDPVFKKMTPLAQARLAAIPKIPGADWRDLPNVETRLSDGTTAYKLYYTHQGIQHNGERRGVCACAGSDDSAAQCDPMYRQEDTLIPWSLVHTGHKRDHWNGVYGRLQWSGYLHGTVANPEPLSRRGPVIHPEQDRVVSVQECARVQGYSDDFLFVGTVLEQYKQIAAGVPPLVACAVGAEILKVL
ncbi:unnamed protein product [Ixodes pacificus]